MVHIRRNIKLLLTGCLLAAVLLTGSLAVYAQTTTRGSASINIIDDGTTTQPVRPPGGSGSSGGGTTGGSSIRDGDVDRAGATGTGTGTTGTPDGTVSIFDTEVPLAALGDLPKTGSNSLAAQLLLLVGITCLAGCKAAMQNQNAVPDKV